MHVAISEKTLLSMGLTEKQFKRELAVLLYSMEKMTLMQACELAELSNLQFEDVLVSRNMLIYYEVTDFDYS